MDIFESLEELNVSEECFEDIVSMVEAMISERKYSEEEMQDIANNVYDKRAKEFHKAFDAHEKIVGDTNPENFTPVKQYRANKAAEKLERAQDRLNHAEEVAKLPKEVAKKRFIKAES